MYAFAHPLKYGKVSFIAFNTKVFTYPTLVLARTDFQGIKDQAHLYRLHPDLSVATLVDRGTRQGAPDEFEPTEIQKQALYQSFVYKSLLEWVPNAEENMSQV